MIVYIRFVCLLVIVNVCMKSLHTAPNDARKVRRYFLTSQNRREMRKLLDCGGVHIQKEPFDKDEPAADEIKLDKYPADLIEIEDHTLITPVTNEENGEDDEERYTSEEPEKMQEQSSEEDAEMFTEPLEELTTEEPEMSNEPLEELSTEDEPPESKNTIEEDEGLEEEEPVEETTTELSEQNTEGELSEDTTTEPGKDEGNTLEEDDNEEEPVEETTTELSEQNTEGELYKDTTTEPGENEGNALEEDDNEEEPVEETTTELSEQNTEGELSEDTTTEPGEDEGNTLEEDDNEEEPGEETTTELSEENDKVTEKSVDEGSEEPEKDRDGFEANVEATSSEPIEKLPAVSSSEKPHKKAKFKPHTLPTKRKESKTIPTSERKADDPFISDEDNFLDESPLKELQDEEEGNSVVDEIESAQNSEADDVGSESVDSADALDDDIYGDKTSESINDDIGYPILKQKSCN